MFEKVLDNNESFGGSFQSFYMYNSWSYYNSLKLINSFPSRRKFRTKIDPSYSPYLDLLVGVPQGSILVPFFFMHTCAMFFYAIANLTLITQMKKKTKKTITWWGQPSETLIFIRVLLGVELITNYKNNCYKNNNKNNNSCYFIFLDYQIILFNTVFKSLLILDHILGPRNDILFCPKTVFRRDISNAICDHLWSIKRRCEYFVEIGWCQLIPRIRDSLSYKVPFWVLQGAS